MKTTTAQTTTTSQIPYPEIDADTAPSFDIDITDFLNPSFNTVRERSYPTATVINGTNIVKEGVGFFVSEKNLIQAGWKNIDKSKFVEADFNEGPERGYILSQVNMAIIVSSPVYLRFKTSKSKNGQMAGAMLGWLSDYQEEYDGDKNGEKKLEPCCDRLALFLDENNQPLHKFPIKIRFRNVAHWDFSKILEDFYLAAESAFTDYALERKYAAANSAKDDKWRATVALKCSFSPVKVGPDGDQSQCCKVKEYTPPTKENLKDWLLFQPELKSLIWKEYDLNVIALSNSVAKLFLSGSKSAPARVPALVGSSIPNQLRPAEVDF